MDLMTCTELSIAPTDGFDDDRVGFPDNSSLSSMDASEAFSDPQHLTAQVKLHRIKYRIIERISELRSGDADETHRLLAPCLEALRYWRLEFHASLEYAEDGGFAESTLARPEMRTIASILMRYNQVRPSLLSLYSIELLTFTTVLYTFTAAAALETAVFSGQRTDTPCKSQQ